jgi:hypothetical protein
MNQYNDDFYNSFFAFQTRFDIPKYYLLEKPIGTGGFGVVLRATLLETGEIVAIKKIVKVQKYFFFFSNLINFN